MHSKNKLGITVFAIILAIFLAPAVLATPNGVTVEPGTPVTRGFFSSGSFLPTGGAMVNITVSVETQTIAWQGFFGEIDGNMTLDDTSGDSLFNWTGFVNGTVFATRDSGVDFSNITAQNECTIDESLTGTNSDRVNNTFTASSNTALDVGLVTIGAGTACATNTYVNSASQSTSFEETILTDDGGGTAVYATRIEDDVVGFDGNTHDYQLIVPDQTNSSISTYYFFAEIN